MDYNLKTKSKNLWKYVSKFKKNDHVTQFRIGENVIRTPRRIFEAFTDHISSIFNSPSSVVLPENVRFIFSDFLNVPLIPL